MYMYTVCTLYITLVHVHTLNMCMYMYFKYMYMCSTCIMNSTILYTGMGYEEPLLLSCKTPPIKVLVVHGYHIIRYSEPFSYIDLDHY